MSTPAPLPPQAKTASYPNSSEQGRASEVKNPQNLSFHFEKDIHNAWSSLLAPTSSEARLGNVSRLPIGGRTEIVFPKPRFETPRIVQNFATEVSMDVKQVIIESKNFKEESISEVLNIKGKLLKPLGWIWGFFKALGGSYYPPVYELVKQNIFGIVKKDTKPKPKDAKEAEKMRKEQMQARNRRDFFNNLRGIGGSDKAALKFKIEEINRKLGSKNLEYEGVLDSRGQVRADVQAQIEKNEAEAEKERIRQKKQSMLAAATKGKGKKAGPAVDMNLNTAAELGNQNVTKLIG